METNLAETINKGTAKSPIIKLVPGMMKDGLVLYNDGIIIGFSDFDSRKLGRIHKSDDLNLNNLSLRPNEYKSVPFLYVFKQTGVILGLNFWQYQKNIDALLKVYEREGNNQASEQLMHAREKTVKIGDLGILVDTDYLRRLTKKGKASIFFPTERLLETYVHSPAVYTS